MTQPNGTCLAFHVLTCVGDEDPSDEVDDAVGGDDVLLQHNSDAVDRQAVAVAADLDGAALGGLEHRPRHDGFRALGAVQQVVFDQGLGETDTWRLSERGDLNCLLFILNRLDAGPKSDFTN